TAIKAMLEATVSKAKPGHWRMEGEPSYDNGVTSGWFTFETALLRGKGHIRLKDGKCWTLLTTITEIKGFEEKKGETRVPGVRHGVSDNRKTWLELKTQEEAELGHTRQPYCVIIGGGQGGIGLGARLKRLEVPTIIIEKNSRPGDSWRNRYKSLCLHDPVWYDHLPYLPFPDDWPVFSPKDKIGDWLESYTKVMELNYWSGTECKRARWRDHERDWEITVQRNGETVVLKPKHIVFATGMSAVPNLAEYPGMERFKGTQVHSSKFKSSDEWKGKKAVVVGSNNSAHDICA